MSSSMSSFGNGCTRPVISHTRYPTPDTRIPDHGLRPLDKSANQAKPNKPGLLLRYYFTINNGRCMYFYYYLTILLSYYLRPIDTP